MWIDRGGAPIKQVRNAVRANSKYNGVNVNVDRRRAAKNS